MRNAGAGTFLIDGLVEGPLPDVPGFRQKLEAWVTLMGDAGLRLSLAIEGGRFSLLGASEATPVGEFDSDPALTLQENLQHLLDLVPPDRRTQVFSTLRTVATSGGRETHTAYFVNREARIETRVRVVDGAATEGTTSSGLPPITPRMIMTIAGIVIVVAAISTFFVDYKTLFHRTVDRFTSVSTSDVVLDAAPFAQWFTVAPKSFESDPFRLVITVTRTPAYPTNDAAFAALLATPGLPLRTRLAIEAMARGYARCEVFDAEQKCIAVDDVRLRDLEAKDSIEVAVRMPLDRRPRAVSFVP